MTLVVNMQKSWPGFQLDVSFSLEAGMLGLLGPSGAGKSMTLRCIAGLQKPDRGRISLGGQVFYDSQKKISLPPQQRKVGFLFQNYALFPHLNVRQNIALGLRGLKQKEQISKIREMLLLVKLQGLEERYPHQLSGGQQQRVALARALAPRPNVLLLDEPFSALDSHLRAEMEQEVHALLSTFPGKAVFVTHKLDEAYRLCPQLLILEKGRVTAGGSREALLSNPPTLAAARMMGCENISRARLQADGSVHALDWGCRLQLTVKKQHSDAGHAGIYGNHIRLAEKEDKLNTLECRVVQVMESPHHLTVKVQVAKPAAEGCLKLTWPKEKWQQRGLQKGRLIKLYLPEDKIFLTGD